MLLFLEKMTVEAIIEMLLQHGSLGLFAAYLIFESRRIRTQFSEDLDKLANKDDKELASLREQYEAREEKWQMVVAKYDDQIIGDRDKLERKIEKLADKVESLDKKTDHMLISMDSLSSAIAEIKIRDNPQLQYAEYMIGLSKVLQAKKLTEFTGQTCVVIVRWTDFTGWISLREYKRIGWGGRTDRDDFQDLEPMAFFTASAFKA